MFAGFSVRYNSHVQNIDKAFVDLDDDGTLVTGVREWMETHQSGTTLLDLRAGVNLNTSVRVACIVNNVSNEVYSLRPLSIEAPRTFQVQLSTSL